MTRSHLGLKASRASEPAILQPIIEIRTLRWCLRNKDSFASSWAQALLKFCLAHDAVTCVIPATGKVEHMKDNMQSGFGQLPNRSESEQLKKLFA